MAKRENDELFDRIRAHAFTRLSSRQREKTNLYLDYRVYGEGEKIGPAFQKIVVSKPSILVFADDEPMANFGHNCRYILYDAESGDPHSEIAARFPPFLKKAPETLKPFHQPVRMDPNLNTYHVPPILRCPVLVPDGNRYAILYAGMSNKRHLNDLEFCYRMLIDRYGFDKSNIYVLSYDGTLDTPDGPQTVWPGDGTAYRIHIHDQGNRAAFENVFNILKAKLQAHDLLFIHTNNHGDNFGSGSFLCTYPAWGEYMASDFCNDLAALPKYRSLLVMMEQCNSGGFNAPVIAASTAANTSIASAAIATQSSYVTADLNWDTFARDWIAAQIGHEPNGGALAHNADTNGNGVIEAIEAFNYALSVQNPLDSPNFSQSSAAGGNITLGMHYRFAWWWCWIFLPILEEYRLPIPRPDPEMYAKLQRVLPELQKLMLPEIDEAATHLRKALTPGVQAALREAFGK
jgi:hypothetical protein